ncbi:hypothetical protein T484DRAFT_1950120 [Baffinella frigidus]|nr:hypothetical protein T484DRAFT_1950120 [Cryptophyta sp. CCMP2293]
MSVARTCREDLAMSVAMTPDALSPHHRSRVDNLWLLMAARWTSPRGPLSGSDRPTLPHSA